VFVAKITGFFDLSLKKWNLKHVYRCAMTQNWAAIDCFER
jgi:hypothetical protein